jgi:hypothetical protein
VGEQTTGQCNGCKGVMYHDGLNWRHVENDRPLRECPRPDAYRAEHLNVFFGTGIDADRLETWIAEASTEQWARHIATALNHWAQPDTIE